MNVRLALSLVVAAAMAAATTLAIDTVVSPRHIAVTPENETVAITDGGLTRYARALRASHLAPEVVEGLIAFSRSIPAAIPVHAVATSLTVDAFVPVPRLTITNPTPLVHEYTTVCLVDGQPTECIPASGTSITTPRYGVVERALDLPDSAGRVDVIALLVGGNPGMDAGSWAARDVRSGSDPSHTRGIDWHTTPAVDGPPFIAGCGVAALVRSTESPREGFLHLSMHPRNDSLFAMMQECEDGRGEFLPLLIRDGTEAVILSEVNALSVRHGRLYEVAPDDMVGADTLQFAVVRRERGSDGRLAWFSRPLTLTG